MRYAATRLAAFILAALLNLAYWAWEGRPIRVPDAGVGRIESVSFSPYRRGQDPLAHITPSLAEISADVATLARHVAGIRTYTSLEGLDQVPRYARPLGLKVVQGVWLGREPDVNEREIRSVVELATRYPDVIDRVIVGNEVLLRRDLTAEQLIGYIRRVKSAIKQPVSYADVWEFWVRNPTLAEHVDFVTIHILPYWEDEPVPIDHAIDHVWSIYRKVQAAFPGKRIMIGEVGWPSAGRMRDGALPSLVNEARLTRGFLGLAREHALDYNLFAAFDEPWKRALEGTVGGHWGILDAERRVKFALAGPVSNDPNWRWHFAISTAFAMIGGLLAWWRWPSAGRRAIAIVAGAAQLLGAVLVLGGALIVTICWTPFGWLTGSTGLAANLVLSVLLLRLLGDRLSMPSPSGEAPLPTAEEALNLLRGKPTRGPTLGERLLGLLQFGFVVSATVVTVALIVDPRYRDFPSEAFLMPAVGYAILALILDRHAPPGATLREERLLVGLMALGAVGVPIGEGLRGLGEGAASIWHAIGQGLENTQALGWSATIALLALPWALKLAARRRAAMPAVS